MIAEGLPIGVRSKPKDAPESWEGSRSLPSPGSVLATRLVDRFNRNAMQPHLTNSVFALSSHHLAISMITSFLPLYLSEGLDLRALPCAPEDILLRLALSMKEALENLKVEIDLPICPSLLFVSLGVATLSYFSLPHVLSSTRD